MLGNPFQPNMTEERARTLRAWHDQAYENLRANLPLQRTFMALDLHVDIDVFPPHGPDEGDAYHQAIAADVRPSDRVLDMGTGCGVSGILAARVSSDVVAVDVNPAAVACAAANAARNGVADRITFLQGDLFDAVDGDFDLIVFDPPFRWFRPRDLLEMSTADEGYATLTRFMAESRARLRPGGRILLHFGTSGDMDYLYSLVERAGFRMETTHYGQAVKDGTTADYYILRLSI